MLFLPIKTDSPLRNTPWANWALIAANVIVFFLQRSNPAFFNGLVLDTISPKLYQFVTYAFLHADFWHIGGNMLFLYIFGNNLCDRLGNWGYVGFYLAGAVFAGVGYVPFSDGRVEGASGAVAAVTGAYIALFPRTRVTIFFWLFIFMNTIEIPCIWLIGAFFAQDVILNFLFNDNIAHGAHIAGTIFGFTACMMLLKTRLLPRDHFDMLALLDRWNRRREYQGVVNKGFDPFGFIPKQPGQTQSQVLGEFDRLQEMRAEIAEEIARGRIPRAAELYRQLRQRDAGQTLSRGSQMDIANYLYSEKDYINAGETYELFLKSYSSSEQASQVHLMLGLIYSRYLPRPAQAKDNLLEAIRLLKNDRELDLAKSELLHLEGVPH